MKRGLRIGIVAAMWLCLGALGPAASRTTLRCGWYVWPPYQYTQTRQDIEVLTGLDVQLVKGVLKLAGYSVVYEPVPWAQQLRDLQNGDLDIASGATFTPERGKYAFFSEPYRIERSVLYVRREDVARYRFHNLASFLSAVREGALRVGVVEGFVHAAPELQRFLGAMRGKPCIQPSGSDPENFQKLVGKTVDGVLCDRLVGIHIASAVGIESRVTEYPLDLGSVPIHVMFSRKTCSEVDVMAFNRGLAAFKAGGQYRDTLRSYMLPLLVAQCTSMPWFRFLDFIGAAAFALSGVLLARKERYNIVGALLLAALPAVGGGLARDLITGRHPVGILRTPVYLLIVLFVVLLGYVAFFIGDRLSAKRRVRPSTQRLSLRIAQHVFQWSDTLGLAAFTVIGVGVALETHSQPIWLWGPLLAAMTGAGGTILRDIVRADYYHPALKSSIYAEIPLIWGGLLALFFDWQCERLVPSEIHLGVLVTVIGAFACRLFVIYAPVKRYFLYAPYAYDPAVKLRAIFKLEAEMVERFPSYVSVMLEDQPGKGIEEVELIHSLTRKNQLRIMGAMGALATERLEPAYIAELLRIQQRTSLLAVLSNDLYELVREGEDAQETQNLQELIDHILNALHTVLSQAVEAIRAVDAGNVELLIELTDDRSELMSRLRRQYQEQGTLVSPADARHLWRLTTMFDRVVWVLHQYGALLRQGRPA